ncbi:hypothetical protein DKK70_09490 [Gilliamella apicola]|uniref:Uncharacterized protein n=1 Tax=Gilliamella apicola TaxID=1196095 RepID=A0A2V4E940_9GAMM|nr:hypothetical protein [Gilliamella apicola]PXZ06884.1 hypothetical protein DKK70_09490 [Gilliamella apicola]
MSNDVYGYILLNTKLDYKSTFNNYIKSSSLNIRDINKRELFNYPPNLIPNNESFIFDIADGPNSINAEYLIDYSEFAPDTDIDFPTDPKERLDILINTLIDMINITNTSKMVVSMTQCNQIETIKKIKFAEMRDVIHADFAKYQNPPNTLYEIICE